MSADRQRSGCLTCRARKVRCDRGAGVCERCKRLELECALSNGTSLSQEARGEMTRLARAVPGVNQAGLKRIRVTSSCLYCRDKKQKCTGNRPSCARCAREGRECVYPQSANTSRGAIHNSPSRILFDRNILFVMVETFFEEIAPLRCLGFLHKPSFMQQVENGFDEKDPLLFSVCALATKSAGRRELWDIGSDWAERARSMILDVIDDFNVHTLQCIVLLHEHATRVDRLSQCFIFSSLAARFCQALQLNVEYDFDIMGSTSSISVTEKESRRRLMWACYINDTVTACGLDQLKLIEERDITVQLPCEDDRFLHQVPCKTECLFGRGFLEAGEEKAKSPDSDEPLGYRAVLIRVYAIRARILRYLKRYEQEEYPWILSSEFSLLLAALEHLKTRLPANLQFNLEIIYIHKEQSLLSSLLFLHLAYHQCYCDLFRIILPVMLFPPKSQTAVSMGASADFLSGARLKWFDEACAITEILRIALDHVPQSMNEPGTSISAYAAISVKVLYLNKIVSEAERSSLIGAVSALIKVDLEYLHTLHKFHPSVAKTFLAAERVFRELGSRSGTAYTDFAVPSNPTVDLDLPAAQASADFRLHPLSMFRQVRENLTEKHVPERTIQKPNDLTADSFLSMAQMGPSSEQYNNSLVWSANQIDENGFESWVGSHAMPNGFAGDQSFLFPAFLL